MNPTFNWIQLSEQMCILCMLWFHELSENTLRILPSVRSSTALQEKEDITLTQINVLVFKSIQNGHIHCANKLKYYATRQLQIWYTTSIVHVQK